MKKYLFKKLFRDISKAKGQFIAVVLVIAVGVSMFLGLSVMDRSISDSIDKFYNEYNLADFTIYFSQTDEDAVDAIGSLDEVAAAEGRVFLNGKLADEDKTFFVHTIPKDNSVSKLQIISGHAPNIGQCLADKKYARANDLKINDKLNVLIEGKAYEFTVSGFFISPEYIYLTDSIQNVMPDPKRFGALFVNESFIEEHFGRLVFNQVLVETNRNIGANDFEKKLLSIDGISGYMYASPQEELLSVKMVDTDVSQLGKIGIAFSVIFFVVAAVIIFISMSRNISVQRNQIGIMKAMGISNSRITLHYLSNSIFTVLVGCIAGALLGAIAVPPLLLSSFDMAYSLPHVSPSGYGAATVFSFLVATAFGVIATISSCRKIFKEKPSEAMRPIPPKKVKPILLEKNEKIWSKISYGNKLMLRNVFSNKLRASLSSVGVIACVGLIIASFSLLDMFSDVVGDKFRETNTYDIAAHLAIPLSKDDNFEFGFDGISDITLQSATSVTFNVGNVITKTDFIALNKSGSAVTLFDSKENKLALPTDGILFPKLYADDFGIKAGDVLSLRITTADGISVEMENVKVAAVYMAYLEQNIYTSLEYMSAQGIDLNITSLLVKISDAASQATVADNFVADERIAAVVKIDDLLKAANEAMKTSNSLIMLIIAMAAVLSLTVIYNITSINIAERRRDIATLKVLGYRNNEVDRLIFIENFLITAFGSIFGIGAGAAMLYALLKTATPSNMMFPYSLSVSSVLIGISLGFVFTFFANLLLKRNTKKIDMVESLKSAE